MGLVALFWLQASSNTKQSDFKKYPKNYVFQGQSWAGRISQLLMLRQHSTVKGLYLLDNFLSKEQEEVLLGALDGNLWEEVVTRRSQQFGRYYNQQKKTMDKHKFTPLPSYLKLVAQRLIQTQLMTYSVEETSWLVQQYKPGQGIHPHIDQFGVKVVGIGLAATAQMRFTRGKHQVSIPLSRRGLYVLSGEARYHWKHEIEEVNKRRISITVRDLTFNEVLPQCDHV